MFPHLPQDIGRTIFEMAAEAGDGKACAVVSKQVKPWVERVIYRSVSLPNDLVVYLLHRTMTDPKTSKTPEFFARHVKFLMVETRRPEAELVEILRACKGVRVLANRATYLDSSAMRELFSSSHLAPTRLCVTAEATEKQAHQLPDPCRMNFSLPIFQNLTRLELICASEAGCEHWDGLSLLSNLTHFAVDHTNFVSRAYTEVAQRILTQCPASLRVFVFWLPRRLFYQTLVKELYAINRGEVDLRAVAGSKGLLLRLVEDLSGYPNYSEYALYRSPIHTTSDWKGMTAGKDFWGLAEDIIERRRKWLQELPLRRLKASHLHHLPGTDYGNPYDS